MTDISDLVKLAMDPEELERLYGPDPDAKSSNMPPDEQLRIEMINNGFDYASLPEFFKCDGLIHKFAESGKRGDNSHWYKVIDNGVYWIGSYGSFRNKNNDGDDLSISFKTVPATEISDDEMIEIEKRSEELREKSEESERKKLEKRIKIAKSLYNNMDANAILSHPYLDSKQIKPTDGLRVDSEGRLIIPLFDRSGNVANLQSIFEDGDKFQKRFEPGITSTGLFAYIPGKKDTTYICEGYATGTSINMATHQHVLCAMSASNLQNMDEFVNLNNFQNPVIVADNDESDEKYPDGKGYHYAKLLANKVNGRVIMIDSVDGKKGSDANDYAVKYGINRLKELLIDWIDNQNNALFESADIFLDGDYEIPQIIEDWIPEGYTLVHARRKSGKSYFALDICFHVAMGLQWNGKQVSCGKVVYFCGEGRRGVKLRLATLCQYYGVSKSELGKRLFVSKVAKNFNVDEQLEHIKFRLSKEIGEGLKLFVVDTLKRHMSGSDSSDEDAGKMLAALSEIQDMFDCSCMVIHHQGKSSSLTNDSRGVEDWTTFADMVIAISRDSEKGKATKETPSLIEQALSKDLEIQDPLYMHLESLKINGAIDSYGKPVIGKYPIYGNDDKTKPDKDLEYFLQVWASHAACRGGFSKLDENGLPFVSRDYLIEALKKTPLPGKKNKLSEISSKNELKPSGGGFMERLKGKVFLKDGAYYANKSYQVDLAIEKELENGTLKEYVKKSEDTDTVWPTAK
jgi:phage/plasmid primase-like uncharacterized protein